MNKNFRTIILGILFLSLASHASELNCETKRDLDNTLTKVVSVSDRSSMYIKVFKMNAKTGLEVPNFTHVFEVNRYKKESNFLKISGIKMVHTGDGINGLTNFDGLNLSVNTLSKVGSLLVQPTYSRDNWSLDFSCSSIPQ